MGKKKTNILGSYIHDQTKGENKKTWGKKQQNNGFTWQDGRGGHFGKNEPGETHFGIWEVREKQKRGSL